MCGCADVILTTLFIFSTEKKSLKAEWGRKLNLTALRYQLFWFKKKHDQETLQERLVHPHFFLLDLHYPELGKYELTQNPVLTSQEILLGKTTTRSLTRIWGS